MMQACGMSEARSHTYLAIIRCDSERVLLGQAAGRSFKHSWTSTES
jgi:hypothetical protein